MLDATVKALGLGISDELATALVEEAYSLFVYATEQYCWYTFSHHNGTKDVSRQNHEYATHQWLLICEILAYLPNRKYADEFYARTRKFDNDKARERWIKEIREAEKNISAE